MSLIEQALRKRKASFKPEERTAGMPGAPATPRARDRRQLGDPARIKRVDFESLRQQGLIGPPVEERAIGHQFRNIKRPLIQRAFDDTQDAAPGGISRRSIMLTSALSGDGKTFTSLNLALSMALERDHSVILVDGDVAKPHLSKVFQAEQEPGLLDVLEDSSRSIESVILQTEVPDLYVVPVGKQSAQATELLASARMRSLILELEAVDPQCMVVFDSPPILMTSEARVLAGLFAQVVMVVRAGVTPQQAVLDAIQLVGGGAQVSLVLNQAVHLETGGYYGYGSGFNYGVGPGSEGQP